MSVNTGKRWAFQDDIREGFSAAEELQLKEDIAAIKLKMASVSSSTMYIRFVTSIVAIALLILILMMIVWSRKNSKVKEFFCV